MSFRIRKLAGMVRPGLITADIGTDHGLLPILIVEQAKTEKAYACDVAEGPLAQAKANIAAHGLEGKVIPVLSDGFEHVPDDIQCAVLAGMGPHTAVRILEQAGDRLRRIDQIIVQVNDDVPMVRRWACAHDFVIRQELTIEDRGHFYTALDLVPGTAEAYSEQDILCGALHTIADPESWTAFAEHEISRLSFILERRGNDPQLEQQRKHYINALEQMKNES